MCLMRSTQMRIWKGEDNGIWNTSNTTDGKVDSVYFVQTKVSAYCYSYGLSTK